MSTAEAVAESEEYYEEEEEGVEHIIYNAEPTAVRFHADPSFFRGIMGPIGTGKSVACVVEMLAKAMMQKPWHGVRRTRWAVIRQTYPELKSTSLKTFQEWIPPNICPVKMDPPINGRLVAFLPDRTKMDMEVYFLALENDKDVKKLLSLELTGAWINEAREVPKLIVDGVTTRVGRYPANRQGGPTWSGVIADTNPPDVDHWWYHYAEEGAWRKNDPLEFNIEEMAESLDAETLAKVEESVAEMKGMAVNMDWKFFRQPGALLQLPNGKYTVNPAAENVDNHKLRHYYWLRQLAGKDPEFIKVYILGEYGNVFTGRPVYQGIWDDTKHVAKEPLRPIRELPLRLGFDFGRTPACVIAQLTPMGRLLVLRELYDEGTGLRQFIQNQVKPLLANEFPGMRLMITGDPSGADMAQADEISCQMILSQEFKMDIELPDRARNKFDMRREAVIAYLSRLVEGRPAFQLDPSCTMLRKGFIGGYKFRRVRVDAGEEIYKNEADKNKFSHLQDALQYVAMEGEANFMSAAEEKARPVYNFGGGWEGYV